MREKSEPMPKVRFNIRGTVETDGDSVAEFLGRLGWRVETQGSVADAIRSEIVSNLADVLAHLEIEVEVTEQEAET